MLTIILSINPNFGKNLYNTFQPILFYISILVVLYMFICVLLESTKEKKFKIMDTVKMVIISATIVFIVSDPLILGRIGEFTYNFLIDLLNSFELVRN